MKTDARTLRSEPISAGKRRTTMAATQEGERVRAWVLGVPTAVAALCWAQAVFAGETITFFHNDVSGTPLMATDTNGMQAWEETYQPYGDRLLELAASRSNALWFIGQPQDDDTGLSYMGARYYDPMLGRFMGVDPLSGNSANLHSWNRYAYANNNPYRFVDPTGLQANDPDDQDRDPPDFGGSAGHPEYDKKSGLTDYWGGWAQSILDTLSSASFNRQLSRLRRIMPDGTLGASIGGSAIVGPFGRDARLGLYVSCCESPDIVVGFTWGTPAPEGPNWMISNARLSAMLAGEWYKVGFDHLRGQGSAINFATPLVGTTATYGPDFQGDPIGYAFGRSYGYGFSATDTQTYGYGLRDVFMQVFEWVDD
jgi:RHS repeat-associated protein